MAIIANTLEVADLWVSAPLAKEASTNRHLHVGEARPVPFNAAGALEQEKLFPHCVRARRYSKHA
jgi:hypothetical protein